MSTEFDYFSANTDFVTRRIRLYVPKETLMELGVSPDALQERLQAVMNALSPQELASIMAETQWHADARN